MQLASLTSPKPATAQARQPVHDRYQEETFDESPQSDGFARRCEPARACWLRIQQQHRYQAHHPGDQCH
jgi:hypothetical protein